MSNNLAHLRYTLPLVLTACVLSAAAQTKSTPPSITSQPASLSVKVGTTATFKVGATGTAPLVLQWYKNGNAIAGATSGAYTTPPTTDADNYSSFYVTVKNSVGSVGSSYATLIVGDPPAIVQQPASATITIPGFAVFSVYNTGSYPLTYQWYKNGNAIAASDEACSNAPTCTTGELSASDTGDQFYVKINNQWGSVVSNIATVTAKSPTLSGTSPIVGQWAGTETFVNSDSTTSTSNVDAAFSQTSYALTCVVVYTDESGIPILGGGVASLNGSNVYIVTDADGDGTTAAISGGFTTNLLTLNMVAGASDGETGSGNLLLSADHNTLTGTGSYTDGLGGGGTVTWTLSRQK